MEDILSKGLEKEIRMGSSVGLQIAKNVWSLNHSQFVDDNLLLVGDSKIISKILKKVLDSYLEVLGAKVDNTKCQMFGWNCLDHILRSI